MNRELAGLFCKQRRYPEAESHARSVYQIAPTNPFIIDILLETLLGKQQIGLPVDQDEINRLLGELRVYGDAPGSSFYLVRDAQRRARSGDRVGALKSLANAIERTPSLLSPYFIRADVLIAMNDIPGAERDLETISKLLSEAGGFSEGEEAQVHELEVRIANEKRQYKVAKQKIDTSAFLTANQKARLRQQLTRSISFSPEGADLELREWAKHFGTSAPADADKRGRGSRSSRRPPPIR